MKTIIAGSRGITDYALVVSAVARCGWRVTEVLSGAAPGVDTLGAEWARLNCVPVSMHPANWAKYGPKRAGPLRNSTMAAHADALIAVWDGKSPGTKDMIDRATRIGLRVYVWRTDVGC